MPRKTQTESQNTFTTAEQKSPTTKKYAVINMFWLMKLRKGWDTTVKHQPLFSTSAQLNTQCLLMDLKI